MDAKIIATTIMQMADLARSGSISLELHGTVNAALWELAARKDLREEVTDILRQDALEEMGV